MHVGTLVCTRSFACSARRKTQHNEPSHYTTHTTDDANHHQQEPDAHTHKTSYAKYKKKTAAFSPSTSSHNTNNKKHLCVRAQSERDITERPQTGTRACVIVCSHKRPSKTRTAIRAAILNESNSPMRAIRRRRRNTATTTHWTTIRKSCVCVFVSVRMVYVCVERLPMRHASLGEHTHAWLVY